MENKRRNNKGGNQAPWILVSLFISFDFILAFQSMKELKNL
jgi:hypothetical protein